MNEPDFYADKAKADSEINRAGDLQKQLDELFIRWEYLEDG